LIVTGSVVSVAVNVGLPAVRDVTVNVTTPKELEGPEAAEIVSRAPRLDTRLTVLPGTGLLFKSSSVTATVELLTPSAVTNPGEAVTVDTNVSTGPGVYATVAAVWLAVPPSTALPSNVATNTPFPVAVGAVTVAV